MTQSTSDLVLNIVFSRRGKHNFSAQLGPLFTKRREVPHLLPEMEFPWLGLTKENRSSVSSLHLTKEKGKKSLSQYEYFYC
jgi:hypothetical protein